MDLEKLQKLRERFQLTVVDARNQELNKLDDAQQMIYLSATFSDLLGSFYAMFTIVYKEDLQRAIKLAQDEIEKSIIENYEFMKADNIDSDID